MCLLVFFEQFRICLFDKVPYLFINNTFADPWEEEACHKISPILLDQVTQSKILFEYFLRLIKHFLRDVFVATLENSFANGNFFA